LKFAEQAVQEIGEAFDWYKEQSKGLGAEFEFTGASIPQGERCEANTTGTRPSGITRIPKSYRNPTAITPPSRF
jgi:hypothetical protein